MGGQAEAVRFDPHVHTNASSDARGSVTELLTRAVERGLDAVAITDHNTVAGARRAVDSAAAEDILVVPGVEISTADGHLLGLGVRAEPPVGDPLASTIEWVRDRGGLAVIPHPFQVLRHGVRKGVFDDCDGVEVFNAWAVTGLQNRRAGAFARRNDHPQLGASDAHQPPMVGTAYTELPVDTELTVDGVLDTISRGECRARGNSMLLTAYLRRYASSLHRAISPVGNSKSV